jgi:predicted dinucleotide-binding enzyme
MTEDNLQDFDFREDYFYVDDKEEGFAYRWVNSRDRVMLQRKREGWETDPRPTEQLPAAVASLGQELANPAGGTVRQRGDVILMRMPLDKFDRTVRARKDHARNRQRITVDTMVQQANEEARRALAARGYQSSQIRKDHAFSSTPDPEF